MDAGEAKRIAQALQPELPASNRRRPTGIASPTDRAWAAGSDAPGPRPRTTTVGRCISPSSVARTRTPAPTTPTGADGSVLGLYRKSHIPDGPHQDRRRDADLCVGRRGGR